LKLQILLRLQQVNTLPCHAEERSILRQTIRDFNVKRFVAQCQIELSNVQECDATGVDSSNAVDNKKTSFRYAINKCNKDFIFNHLQEKIQMKIFTADTYKQMSQRAANDVIGLMQSFPNKLLCTASGDTPAGLYREIVEKVNNTELNIDNWNFVGLDEWAGMNGGDEGSCRYHLNKQFFYPLKISEEKICFFDGHANPEDECQRTEDFIQQHGGIAVAILGLGTNGHIGMNEPGTSPHLRSHVAEIDSETQKVGQKYFSSPRTITHGITLGIANLMEARHVLLLVSGAHKAGIVKKMLEEEVSEQLPASLLRQHPGLRIYADAEAAQFIQSK